ncbi:MAG: hypothetical protein LBK06_05185 [Planctomycetaceae bacterium]|jgi:hypothetical protein|nr:hypothetical protein [Planctomycetaceae bacterium]
MSDTKYLAYEAYKKFIDELVVYSRASCETERIKKCEKILPPFFVDKNYADGDTYNKFIESLDDVQKRLLSNLLREERIGGFHDTLALLTSYIDIEGFGMTFHGQPMIVGIEGGLHQDFVGRLVDWQWPEKPDSDNQD